MNKESMMHAVSRPHPESQAPLPDWPNSLLSVSTQDGIDQLLSAVRIHLGMDVGFISEFTGDRRFFRHVDSSSDRPPIQAGDWLMLDDGYCKKVVDGDLPELIVDTNDVPNAMAIPATSALPIGSHISVPLRLSDGRVYGTFCCFSHIANTTLNDRDLDVMRAFAAIVAHHIEADLDHHLHYREAHQRIASVLQTSLPNIVYQPIYDLKSLRILGGEALARFPIEPMRSPDLWFTEAGEVGLKAELEHKAMSQALKGFKEAWQHDSIYLGLNCSPQTVTELDWDSLLEGVPTHCLVLEITEHDHVEDYEKLVAVLKKLRMRGVKISVDDAGSGYASMRHILSLKPEVIKLDISLTRAIDSDRMRQALAGALISFANQIGSKVVAEGIETAAEMRTLCELGAHAGQGYFLGQPMAVELFSERLTKVNPHTPKSDPL